VSCFLELEQLVEDAELKKMAQHDLEKLDLTLDGLMADASRLLLPGRDFDASNSLLEVYAGKSCSLVRVTFEKVTFSLTKKLRHLT